MLLRKTITYSAIFLLAACGRQEAPYKEVGVKLGKPYEVNGVTYFPAQDDSYDKVGDGSWYGPGFHGKRTASGEKFNQNDATAAHPTLPMPSLVRVTNLANDQSVVVRINDRGPFHSNRIIDLSKKSAEMIDLKSTKPVRVEYLKDETDAYLAAVKDGQKIDMVEYNQNNIKLATTTKLAKIEEVQTISEEQAISVSDVAKIEQPIKTTIKKSNNFLIADAQANDDVYSKELAQIKPQLQITKKLDEPKILGKIKENSIQKKAVTGKFVVLAGSFSAEENAKNLAKKLSKQHGFSVEKAKISGKIWWKVMTGTITDKNKAEAILADIHKLGIGEARIVKKEM